MSHPQFILASASPRRRELLWELGLSFQVATAGVAELESLSRDVPNAVDLALANARLKAAAVAKSRPDSWILGADTVISLETRLFGKPRDTEQAREFLRALSGRTHEVVTGCVLRGPDGKEKFIHDISHVTVRALAERDITRYLAAVHVMDKAGAYALQEHGDWIIESVEGSRTNVIGLPMEKLAALLQPLRGACDGPAPPLQS